MKVAYRPALRAVVVMALVVVVSFPDGTGAGPRQDVRKTEEEREDVRRKRGDVALEVDVLEGEKEEVEGALVTLAENVAAREAELEEAERAARRADEDLTRARTAVTDAEKRIEALEDATETFAVDAYMNPPTDTMFAALSSRSMSDAAVKHVLIDLQSHSGADLFDQLAEAHEDLELERETAEQTATDADKKRAGVQTALTDVAAAYDQQESFALEVEDALDAKLAEAAVLDARDEDLSKQIADEQAELARQLEAARQAAEAQRQREAEAAAAAPAPAPTPAPAPVPAPAPAPAPAGGTAGGSGGGLRAPSGPTTVTPAPGGLATVSCPGGGAITVAGSLAPGLRGVLDAAGASGLDLCGWGWRDPQKQIELRRAHCGGSEYAIWQMPASQCSPPTARPGRSMHERGLAVDFTCDGSSISTRSHHCFGWLSRNAASHGLYNLPSEPWHWSTTGS